MQSFFEDKVAIVSGGLKGIGASISVELAKVGVKVYALGRNAIEHRLSEDTAVNARIIFKSCDVSSFDSVAEVVDSIKKEAGRIDFLVNNAGITKDNLIMRMSEKDWDDVLNINLKGAFNLSKTVSRVMMSQKFGRIVNIGSIVGTTGNAGQANYSASKAGMIGLTKSLAKELSSRNILVNLIAPGYVQTSMTEKLSEEQLKSFTDNIPLKRAAKPEEISSTVLFFISPAADYITGQILHVDGGLAM